MKILTDAGISFIDAYINRLNQVKQTHFANEKNKLTANNARLRSIIAEASTSSTSSTSATTTSVAAATVSKTDDDNAMTEILLTPEYDKPLAEQMLNQTMDMLTRLRNNNSLDYWRKKENHKDMVEFFHFLDNQRFNFVPVVFNTLSRQLGGVLLEMLNAVDLDQFLDGKCKLALKPILTLSGGDPQKAIRVLADNLKLNIALYDLVDQRQQQETLASDLNEKHVQPVVTFLAAACDYVAYLQGKKEIKDPKHVVELRGILHLGDSMRDPETIYGKIAEYYNSAVFSKVAEQIDRLPIPYSTITEIDSLIKCQTPYSLILTDANNEKSYKNVFDEMWFLGKKSLLIRGIALYEQDLQKLIDKPLHGVCDYYRAKYSPAAAQAIFDKFCQLTKRLCNDIDAYLHPKAKQGAFFGAVKAKVTEKMINDDKKGIAERLLAVCKQAMAEQMASDNPREIRNQTISSRVFSVFKALMNETNIHAACVGHNQISFGRMGDIFNEYIIQYYDLFMEIDFANDPYVQSQLKLQDNLVIPGQVQADVAQSASATSMTK